MDSFSSRVREWLQRVLGTVTRRRTDQDLEQELRSHLELAEAEARHADRESKDGRRPSRLEAGGVAQAMDALRDQRGLPTLENLVRDARYAMRTLRRSPVFTAVAIVTLTLGIAANAAIFQLVDVIRLRPLPVRSPEQLVVLSLADWSRWDGRRTTGNPALTNALWEELRDRQRVFAGVFAWSTAAFKLDRDDQLRNVRGIFVSGNFFSALGVEPALGRVLNVADDRPGCGSPPAVVSHAFWQRVLGGDPTVIGRTLHLQGQAVEVIGVTPPGFFGVETGRSYEVAVPLCAEEVLGTERTWLRSETTWWLTVMGRLRSDETLAQANARLDAMSPGLLQATLPAGSSSGEAADYLSLRLKAESASGGVSVLRARFTDPLLMLAAIAGLVLLILVSNLASLGLSRASTRQREFAVRQSLGASRTRVLQQVLIENVLLAATGAACGLALAGTLSGLLVALLGPEVSAPVQINLRLIGVVTVAVVLIALVLGLAPALRASRAGALEAIGAANVRGSSAGSDGRRLRQTMVVLQVAVSLVLLVGAFLFVGTLRNLLAVDTGFTADGVMVARVDYGGVDVTAANRAAFKERLLEQIASTPGVASAAEVRHVPMSGTGSSLSVWRDEVNGREEMAVRLNAISSGYLRTVGIELIAGRDFTSRDASTSSPVAIVNRSLARRLGITGNPVGQRFRADLGSPFPTVVEIVGFVPDTKYFSLREDLLPIVFVPIQQVIDPRPFADFVIRPAGPLGETAAALRHRLRDVNPAISVDVRPFEATIRQVLVRERLLAVISAFFGALAVVIAAVGLYGVMAELVTRRRGEIGVRIALGAQRHGLLSMLLRQAGSLLLLGVAAGSVLAYVAASAAQPFVFGLEAGDVRVIALAAAALSAPAVLAILVPAWRAARMEPLSALRNQ